ncbi:MAG: hypothetical protein ABI035_12220 [Gemmatimonadaceae bacterium]
MSADSQQGVAVTVLSDFMFAYRRADLAAIAHGVDAKNPAWLGSADGVVELVRENLASDCGPDQLMSLISWLPVLLWYGIVRDRMAETRLQRVLFCIIHLRSTRLGVRTPTGRQAMARPLPQVGSKSAR